MERIDTPTAEADKFGPGKNGFNGTPPDVTQLSSAWFDQVQEEISRVIEGQGIVLDSLDLGQMAEAIDNYAFVDPNITGTLTIDNGATLSVLSGGQIVADLGSDVTVNGAFLVGGLGSFTVNADADFMGRVTLGDLPADAISVKGSMTLNADTTVVAGIGITGTTTSVATFGTLGLLGGAPAPVAFQLAAGIGGQLAWHDSLGPKFVNYSSTGFVYATGDQEAATGLAVSHQVAQTTQTSIPIGGQVRVIVYGEFQVNTLGSTFTIKAQHDQGGWTDIGPNKIVTTLVNTGDVNNWQQFRHERRFAPGLVTATNYRLEVTVQGGHSGDLKEVHLKVVNERY